jgi:transposase InsO family protein
MIGQLQDNYPISFLCRVLDCSRSSYYYQFQALGDDQTLIDAIEQILMRWPFYGYRRVLAQLQRQGWAVGETRVRRLLKWLGHTRSVGRVRVQTTDSRHNGQRFPNRLKGVVLIRPNQAWVADITFIRLGTRFIYLAVILDAYTRAVRGWAVSRTLTAETLTVPALYMALEHGIPTIFHSDQGSQYAAWLHLQPLLNLDVIISMSDTGQPTQNGLVERFMRTLKEEHVDYTEYSDFNDAVRQLRYWLEVEYMTERIHSALDYATPTEFEALAHRSSSLS